MKSAFLYIYLAFNVFSTLTLRPKYKKIKRELGNEEASKYLHKVAMDWARNNLNKAGVKIKAEGLENIPEGACCFIGNHQGNLDIFAILASIDKPFGFIAKKEMEKLPVVPWWMKEMGCVFINRDDVRESLKAINEGAENMKNGHSMVIFPEGTRSKSSEVGEFKKGSLKMATKANVPIVPVAISGSSKILEENNGKISKGEIKLTVGKPIHLENLSREEERNLAEIVRNEIVKML